MIGDNKTVTVTMPESQLSQLVSQAEATIQQGEGLTDEEAATLQVEQHLQVGKDLYFHQRSAHTSIWMIEINQFAK